MNSGRSLIKLSCICFVCFPDLTVKAAASTNKTTKTMHTSTQLVRRSVAFQQMLSILQCEYRFLTSILFDLWNHIFNNWQGYYVSTLIVRHANWENILPKTTYLNPSVHHWNAKMCTSKYTVHFPPLLYISEISCQNSWVFATQLPWMCLFLLQMSGELKYCD